MALSELDVLGPTLCFTQSIHSRANFFWKHPHTQPEIIFHQIFGYPVIHSRITCKVNYHIYYYFSFIYRSLQKCLCASSPQVFSLKVSKRMPNINIYCVTLYVGLSDGAVLTGHMIGLLSFPPHMVFISTP